MGQKQIVETGFGGGLNQRTAAPYVPLGDFSAIANLRQNKNMSLSKRPGNIKVTNQYQLPANAGPANIDVSLGGSLATYGKQLLLTDNAGTACFSPIQGTFGAYSCASETLLTRANAPLQAIINTTPTSTAITYRMLPAFCTDGTHYFYIYIDGSGNGFLTIQDIATGALLRSRYLWGTNMIWAVPLMVGAQFSIVYLDSSGNIKLLGFASPYLSGPALTTTMFTGALTTANIDAVAVGAGFALLITNTASVNLFLRTSSGSAIASNSFTAASLPLEVRLAYSGSGLIWLGWRETTSFILKIQCANATTLTSPLTGPFFTLVGSNANSFGVVPVNATQAAFAVCAGSGQQNVTGYLFDSTAAAGVGAIINQTTVTSANLASKPFVQSSKVYCWVQAYNDIQQASPTETQWGPSSTKNQYTNELIDFQLFVSTNQPVRPVAVDAPRFSLACANRLLTLQSADLSAKISNLCVLNPSSNKWVFLSGIRQDQYTSSFATVTADWAAPQRWRSAQLGTLLLQSSGMVMNWDGEKAFEQGFLWNDGQPSSVANSGGSGSLTPSSTYYYKVVPLFPDAAGNLHRGIPSTTLLTGTGSSGVSITLTWSGYGASDKNVLDSSFTTKLYPTFWEIYRSQANAASNGTDIATTLVEVVPDANPVVYTDKFGDTAIAPNAECYTFGGAEPNACPPGAWDIVTHQGRAWIIADDRSNLYFSKQIVDAEAVNFTDGFTIATDVQDLRALASIDTNLIVFSDRKIFYLDGEGPDDNGSADDYGILQAIQSDVGCIDRRSIVNTPDGVFFQSQLGLYFLDRGLQVTYIGQPVADELTAFPVITSAVLHPTQPWVYFTVTTADGTAGERIVYDYRVQKWYVDTLPGVPISAARTLTQYYWLDSTGQVWQESGIGDNGNYIPSSFTLAPIKPGNIQGWGRLEKILMLYHRQSNCDLVITTTNDYTTGYQSQSQVFWDNALAAFKTEQLGVEIRQADLESVSITIADRAPVPPDGSPSTPTASAGCIYYALAAQFDTSGGLADIPDSQFAG